MDGRRTGQTVEVELLERGRRAARKGVAQVHSLLQSSAVRPVSGIEDDDYYAGTEISHKVVESPVFMIR